MPQRLSDGLGSVANAELGLGLFQMASGIITGTTMKPFFYFWQRVYYLCTFADNVKVAARPKDVEISIMAARCSSSRSPTMPS